MSKPSIDEFSKLVYNDLIKTEPDQKRASDYFKTEEAKDVIKGGYSDLLGKYTDDNPPTEQYVKYAVETVSYNLYMLC